MPEAPSNPVVKYLALIVVAGGIVASGAVGQSQIGGNSKSIDKNASAIDTLKDRVVVESTETQLELQRLRLQQEQSNQRAESRDAAQFQRDLVQQQTLKSILEAVKK